MKRLLSGQVSIDAIIAYSAATPALTDDRPINEYFWLRTPMDEWMEVE
jgi:hypothetical protein